MRAICLTLTVACLSWLGSAAIADEALTGDTTEVLVVGTIHGMHRDNPNYPYESIVRILETFDPDVVCVEIRPEDFRRRSYLTEMMLATIWGIEADRSVVPIDWWDSKNNARDERSEYQTTEEYRLEEAEIERLERESEVIRAFQRQYGKEKKIWRQAKKRYATFWNGAAFNDYVHEGYRISMDVFGDSCVNLYYQTRNDRMLKRILHAIAANPGKRVIVLTGAEHKHYFDDALGSQDGVRLIPFEAILPLEDAAPSPAITALLTDGDAGPYYDMTDPQVAAQHYQDRLVSLMHGPDMDFDPNVVPAANVRQAAILLESWMWDAPFSPALKFELGWFALHTGRYDESIVHMEAALADLDALEETEEEARRRFMWQSAHRTIGLCHDLQGNREEALAAYERGIAVLEQTTSDPEAVQWLMDASYAKILRKPFAWERPPVTDAVIAELAGEDRLVGRYWYVVDNITYAEPHEGPREILLWVALPVDRREHRVRLGPIRPDPTEILHDPRTGNRVVLWRVAAPAEGEHLLFHYDFEVINRSVLTAIDPATVSLPPADSDEIQRYTISEPWLEITPEIAAKAAEVVGDETNPYRQARLLFDWTVDEMTYSYPSIADRGAEKSFARMSGDCGEFSHVFIVMARSLGIPARDVVCNWPQGSGHAWAEIYLEPHGWIPVDTSVAQLVESGLKGQLSDEKVAEFIESRGIPGRERDWLFGNLYPNRVVVFVGENVTFTPLDGPEMTFAFLQPGGAVGHPPAIQMEGLSPDTVSTGFFLFGEQAADPEVAEARAQLALGPAYLAAGLFDRAVPALEAQLAEKPESSTTWFQLGQAYFNLGRHDDARDAFERSLAGTGGSTKPTTDTWSHIFLGMCCDLAGDRDGAVAAYQQAVDVGADHSGSLATAQQFMEEAFSLEEEGDEDGGE